MKKWIWKKEEIFIFLYKYATISEVSEMVIAIVTLGINSFIFAYASVCALK